LAYNDGVKLPENLPDRLSKPHHYPFSYLLQLTPRVLGLLQRTVICTHDCAPNPTDATVDKTTAFAVKLSLYLKENNLSG
jgi:hypothetical protein